MNTAVLFLTFNRHDTTERVFAEIAKVQPPRLYITSDGPRESVSGEAEKVASVRNYLLSNITWDCEVKTLFREKNLGCKYAVSGAINWFFEHEEMGIILEDDCLPDQSFFPYCEELLEKYKDDKRIWHISGDNFQNGFKRGDGDYYFSKYNHIWGWATWRDRWAEYDVEMTTLEYNIQTIKDIAYNNNEFKYWMKSFTAVQKAKINTWDYPYTFSMWLNNGLAVLPNVNLISNIGFGEDSTHTADSNNPYANIPTQIVRTPLNHPTTIKIDKEADYKTYSEHYRPLNILKRITLKLKSIIHDL